MKTIITCFAIAACINVANAQKTFATISGYSSIEEALPAIFYALPFQANYNELNPEENSMLPHQTRYTDFGVVAKHVQFSFKIDGDKLVMNYSGHQMEDKTKGEWEDCPEKLTKKDNEVFGEFSEALKKYKSDSRFKKEVDAKFYSNAKLLLQLMKEYPEIATELWSNNSVGLNGEFAYLMFLNAIENSDAAYSKYDYKVDMELLEVVTDKVPLKIVMYANNKSKTNPDGMHKDIMKLNGKENYWFTKLKAEIVSFNQEADGSYLMVLKDNN
jgi:hypothetical protein